MKHRLDLNTRRALIQIPSAGAIFILPAAAREGDPIKEIYRQYLAAIEFKEDRAANAMFARLVAAGPRSIPGAVVLLDLHDRNFGNVFLEQTEAHTIQAKLPAVQPTLTFGDRMYRHAEARP